MKFEFIKPEKRDNRVPFRDLKSSDVFTISDPNNVKSAVYMKVKVPKNSQCTYDTICLDTGELGYYSEMMKEVIAIDQTFVYKQDTTLSMKLES